MQAPGLLSPPLSYQALGRLLQFLSLLSSLSSFSSPSPTPLCVRLQIYKMIILWLSCRSTRKALREFSIKDQQGRCLEDLLCQQVPLKCTELASEVQRLLA